MVTHEIEQPLFSHTNALCLQLLAELFGIQVRMLDDLHKDGDDLGVGRSLNADRHRAPPGDLYVQINVKPHDFFEREGNDLYCTVPVSMVTAALGGELEVPTLEGRATLKIPEGTQTGKTFRLRGLGVKSVRGAGQGDLLCNVRVETPVRLSKRQRELLRELADTLADDGARHSPETTSWLDKAKQFFDEHLKP